MPFRPCPLYFDRSNRSHRSRPASRAGIVRFFALGHDWARPVPVVHTWGNVLVGRIGPLQASRELFETNEIPPERILGRQNKRGVRG